jgi:hypothetical protein
VKKFSIALHFEGGVTLVTQDSFEVSEAEEVHDDLEELMQDRETGPWKRIGDVSFIWKRLVAFEVDEMPHALPDNSL